MDDGTERRAAALGDRAARWVSRMGGYVAIPPAETEQIARREIESEYAQLPHIAPKATSTSVKLVHEVSAKAQLITMLTRVEPIVLQNVNCNCFQLSYCLKTRSIYLAVEVAPMKQDLQTRSKSYNGVGPHARR